MLNDLSIRLGTLSDLAVLANFNRAIAHETEHKSLLLDVVTAGVKRLLENPHLGFYVVAERQGEIIGSLMVTTEWSDWRNGTFWWVQSVYVQPHSRRQGVYARLYEFVRNEAAKDPQVCGFRLYVDRENLDAQKVYRALGMVETDYKLFEELKHHVTFFEEP